MKVEHLSNGHAAPVNGTASPTEENNNASKEVATNGLHQAAKGKTGDDQDEEESTKKEEQEVVFIQDLGFTVKIVSPGIEPFDIQVRSGR